MAEHKVQHFLARSYLKGFSAGRIGDQHQIWILDKETKEIRLGAVEKTAAFSYYYSTLLPDGSYDHSVEEHFSGIEHDFLQVVDRVKKNIEAANLGGVAPAPTLDDRTILCKYIFVHFLRVPKNMEWIEDSSRKHLERMESMGLLQYGENVLQNYMMKAFSHIEKQSSARAVSVLFSKNVAVEFAVRRRASVFTCDNPVFRYNPRGADGIIHEDTSVFFPLYYRACARLQGHGNQLRLEKHHDLSLIDDINQGLIWNAIREVYANDCERLRDAARRAGIAAIVRKPENVDLEPV
jgi:hypothetical protein